MLGMMQDETFRSKNPRKNTSQYRSKVKKAWNLVYLKGKSIASKDVDKLLAPESLVPVLVSFFSLSWRVPDLLMCFFRMPFQ